MRIYHCPKVETGKQPRLLNVVAMIGLSLAAAACSVQAASLSPGDANGDGAVNLLDLSIVASNYGKSGGWAQGDFNGDGKVDVLDLALFSSSWSNVAPSIGTLADVTVDVGQPVQLTVSATDPNGDPLGYTASPLPAGATMNSSSGQFNWTPDAAYAGTVTSITFSATDGFATVTKAAKVNVRNVSAPPTDAAPVFNPDIPDVATYVGQNTQFTVKATDPEGKAVTLSVTNLPSNASFNATTGVFSWTPAQTRANTWTTIHFAASDGANTTAMPVIFTIAASAPAENKPPVFTATPAQTVVAGNQLKFTVTASDPEGQALTYSASNLPQGATFDAATRSFTWTPSTSQTGSFQANFSVSDGKASASQTVAITVTAPAANQPPVFTPIADISATVGQLTQVTVKATDPEGKAVTLSATGLPTGATFNAATGAFSWTPSTAQASTSGTINFTASDGSASSQLGVKFTVGTVVVEPPPVGGGGVVIGTGTTPEGYKVLGQGKTNAFYIDNDGDGYGVASPKGPDADDKDATVNTTASAMAKYGSITNYVKALGYNPKRIFYVATNGNNSTGTVNDVNKPFATYTGVKSKLVAGDMVIFRGGTHRDAIALEYPTLNATAADPIVFLNYPGEKAIIDTLNSGIRVTRSSYIVFDGMIIVNSDSQHLGDGISGNTDNHLTFRNIEVKDHYRGLMMMQDLRDMVLENCVFHDNGGEHGIYIGCRELPNTNLTIRGCLSYHNAWHGIQINGNSTNQILENNIVHSNGLAGFSIVDGIHNSFFRNNLIFNNAKQGMVFYFYNSSYYTTASYAAGNNVIEGNTIWVGQYANIGDTQPTNYAAILFNDDSSAQAADFGNTIIRNNIISTHNGATVQFMERKWALTDTIENNVIFRYNGPSRIVDYAGTLVSFSGMTTFNSKFRNNVNADPKFVNAPLSLYATPEKFNFELLSGSPAINLGLPTGTSPLDLHGKPRSGKPDAGVYEF